MNAFICSLDLVDYYVGGFVVRNFTGSAFVVLVHSWWIVLLQKYFSFEQGVKFLISSFQESMSFTMCIVNAVTIVFLLWKLCFFFYNSYFSQKVILYKCVWEYNFIFLSVLMKSNIIHLYLFENFSVLHILLSSCFFLHQDFQVTSF